MVLTSPFRTLQRSLLPVVLVALAMGVAVRADLAELDAQVAALPSDKESAKKVVLQVALERVRAMEESGAPEAAAELAADIGKALQTKTAPGGGTPSAGRASTLAVPKTPRENPYIQKAENGARSEFDRKDYPWPSAADGNSPFAAKSTKDRDARLTAARMDCYLWLYSNPASALRGDSEVLARFLRRAHAYAETIDRIPSLKVGLDVFDDFAMAPASFSLREFAWIHPDLLLPSQRAQWDRAMRIAGDKVLARSDSQLSGRQRGYANIDIALAYQLLNFGLYLNDKAMLERSAKLVDQVERAILPDGGTHYLGTQNESMGYHDVVAMFIARIYEITGEERLLSMLKRMEWYGPVSVGKRGEYWTAPSWKHTWNSELKGVAGGEVVYGVTRNPYVAAVLGNLPKPDDTVNWWSARASINWYLPRTTTVALPENVIYPDHNIQGPRASFGRFYYAATLRDIAIDEPGHSTLMGAAMLGPAGEMQTFLMGVFPRVHLDPAKDDPRAWAWITSGMKSTQVFTRSAVAFSADYDMATFGSSTKGKMAEWHSRQTWLGTGERLIGLIETTPNNPAAAAQVAEGVVRMGTGGTVGGPKQQLVASGDGEYAFGDFRVRIHQQNFGGVDTRTVPFRRPEHPFQEIVCQGTETSGTAARRFLVEIRPSWVRPLAEAPVLRSGEGMIGFEVRTETKQWTLLMNASASPIPTNAVGDGRTSSIHSSTRGILPSDGKATAAPGELLLRVQSDIPSDHLAGWSSYQELVSPEAKR